MVGPDEMVIPRVVPLLIHGSADTRRELQFCTVGVDSIGHILAKGVNYNRR
jgi:hypothetical protein